jgi:hypothetical protein
VKESKTPHICGALNITKSCAAHRFVLVAEISASLDLLACFNNQNDLKEGGKR